MARLDHEAGKSMTGEGAEGGCPTILTIVDIFPSKDSSGEGLQLTLSRVVKGYKLPSPVKRSGSPGQQNLTRTETSN